jgi:uncharacterized protein (TIGR00369 family)
MKQSYVTDSNGTTKGNPRNCCFGCGSENPIGLQLEFELNPDGNSYVCKFEIGSRFVGPPGHAHGGIIATILDEAMGKVNKLAQKTALTRRIEVEYLRPVPLGKPLVAEGRIIRTTGRALYNSGELRDAKGVILARSRGTFLTINAEEMFAEELEAERRNAANP